MNANYNVVALVGRILLSVMFIISGWGKIGGFAGTVGYIQSVGLPMPQVMAAGALVLELVAGVLLVIGWKTRWAAWALAAFTLIAGVLFHNYWSLPADKQMMQQIMFLKNLSVAGGLMMLAVAGPGALSIDRR